MHAALEEIVLGKLRIAHKLSAAGGPVLSKTEPWRVTAAGVHVAEHV